MKTSGLITKLAAVGAVAIGIAFAAAPASADFYRGPEFSQHDARIGERMNRDRGSMWREGASRYARGHEHCLSRFHHEHRDGEGYRR